MFHGSMAGSTRMGPGAQRGMRARSMRSVRVGVEGVPATLNLLPRASGLVIWFVAGGGAAGAGLVGLAEAELAQVLAQHRLATLFVELLQAPSSAATAAADDGAAAHDPARVAACAVEVLDWAAAHAELGELRAGLCAADAAAAGALLATTLRPARVAAVVARSGRPDLVGTALGRVAVPTLLIVGGNDVARLALNRSALLALNCEKRLEVVPGAGPAFDEPGAQATMVHLAAAWLADRLASSAQRH
jgi:hypothetical protein